jgi:hypothetical protein
MARAKELANFNIVVEKWDSSKIGGKRSGSKGKQGGAKGYTTAQERAHPTHGLPQATTRAQCRIGCGHAGCRSGGSSLDIDGGALSTKGGGGGQGWQALEVVRLIKLRTLVSLSSQLRTFMAYDGGPLIMLSAMFALLQQIN